VNIYNFKIAVKELIDTLPPCSDCGAPALYLRVEDSNDLALDFCEECMPKSLIQDYENGYTRNLKKVMNMLEEDAWSKARQRMNELRRK